MYAGSVCASLDGVVTTQKTMPLATANLLQVKDLKHAFNQGHIRRRIVGLHELIKQGTTAVFLGIEDVVGVVRIENFVDERAVVGRFDGARPGDKVDRNIFPTVQVHEYLGGTLASADDGDATRSRLLIESSAKAAGVKHPGIAFERRHAIGNVRNTADAEDQIAGQIFVNLLTAVA